MRYVSPILDDAKRDWNHGRGKILLAIAAGWALSIGVRLGYPVLLPYLQVAYDLTFTTAGLLLTVLWLAYALGQLPGGLLADRIGEGRTMVASMATAAITLALVVMGGPSVVLFLATALFGFGTALFGVVRLSALSDVYPDRLGTAFGLISAAGDVGNTLIPPAAGVIAALTVWQLGFGVAIPLYALVAVACWIVVPARTSGSGNAGATLSLDSARHVLSGLHTPAITLVLAIQILGVLIWNAFTGFYPTYLIEVKGLSASVASAVFALFFALGIVIKPISGNGYDRVGARYSLLLVTGISGAALVVLPLVDGFWTLIAVTALLSAMLGRGTIALSYVTDALPGDILNTGLGTLRTTYMTIGAAGPVVFGAIADRGFFDEAFLLLAVLSGLTLVLIWWLPEQ